MVRFCEGQLPLFPGTHASLVSYCLGVEAFRVCVCVGGVLCGSVSFLESSLYCGVGGVCFCGQFCVIVRGVVSRASALL